MYFKISLILCLLSIGFTSTSQNFAGIDAHAKSAPKSAEKSVETLAAYLNEKTSTDLEKVRAYYVWLTHNVVYDTKTFFSGNPNPKTSAEDALKYKKAVCQGYSELFKSLCEQSGIPVFLISGYSKGYGYSESRKITAADHAWNAVFIDKQWHLLDATWGGGYLDEKKDYVKKFAPEFFLSKPEVFILKHLPVDPMWQLLSCPISIDDYKKKDAEISQQLTNCKGNFNYADTISAYQKLSAIQQQMESADRAFRFNPENFDAPGFALLNFSYDMGSELSYAYEKQDYKKALELNQAILTINEKALYYLRKSKNPQATQALNVCKQNIESSKGNIKSLEDFLK
jgi:hypothetical protein